MFEVQEVKCNQCLFSNERIVSLKRMKDILKTCRKDDTFFICHKAQVERLKSQPCCRGFWDQFKNEFNLGRIAQRLGVVRFVNIGRGADEKDHGDLKKVLDVGQHGQV